MSAESGGGSTSTRHSDDAPSPFEWVREIATGGMGSVQLVLRREGTFRRLYAVKRLLPHLRKDDGLRAMFLDEARVAGLLRHPNVVSVLDIGEDASGPYLLMDYVEGISLFDALKRSTRTIPVTVGLGIVARAADGLHAAHELESHEGRALGLIHRDVSPHNLLIGFDGGVRVTDFGVAKAVGQTTATAEGVLKGKLGYMSPEQLRFRKLDRRSDLFSLGVVLFEVLAGTRLYAGDTGLRSLLDDPPPDVGELRAEVPPAAVELCMQLLAKEPAQRPATAKEVADRIAVILSSLAAGGEETMSTEAFMKATFADVAKERRKLDSKAMSEADERRSARSQSIETPARRSRPLAMIAVLLGLGGLGALGALAWALGLGPTPAAVDEGAEVATSVAEPTPAATEPPPSSEPTNDPAPAAVDEPIAVGEETTLDTPATPPAAEPTRRTSRARRPRRTTAQSAPGAPEMSGGQIPQWGWSSDRVAR